MKRIAYLVLAALLCIGTLIAAGCGGNQDQKHIAMVFSHEPNRWTQGAEMMKQALEKEGMQVDLYVFDSDASQTDSMEKAVASKPDCIVLLVAMRRISRNIWTRPRRMRFLLLTTIA